MENKQPERKTSIELHAHLHLEKENESNVNYGLEDIIYAMENNNLDIVAALYFDDGVRPGRAYSSIIRLLSELRKKGYEADYDDVAAKITNPDGKNFYFVKGKEILTSDDFHIITIGSDKIRARQSIRDIIELAIEENAFVTFDHFLADCNKVYKQISKEKENMGKKVCEEYRGYISLEWNAYCLNLYWNFKKLFGGKNVNEEAVKLAKKINESPSGLDIPLFVPLVTDTDIHARSKGSLGALGTGRILIPYRNMDFSSGRKIVDSMKSNIFSGNYENTYKNVSFGHFFRYFFLPYVFSRFCHRPRG